MLKRNDRYVSSLASLEIAFRYGITPRRNSRNKSNETDKEAGGR